jgi:hypothetical protein
VNHCPDSIDSQFSFFSSHSHLSSIFASRCTSSATTANSVELLLISDLIYLGTTSATDFFDQGQTRHVIYE